VTFVRETRLNFCSRHTERPSCRIAKRVVSICVRRSLLSVYDGGRAVVVMGDGRRARCIDGGVTVTDARY